METKTLPNHTDIQSDTFVCPYTKEQLRMRIAQAERESAAGLGIDSEEMFRELELEFEEEAIELAEAI
jgi:hypothetical protein